MGGRSPTGRKEVACRDCRSARKGSKRDCRSLCSCSARHTRVGHPESPDHESHSVTWAATSGRMARPRRWAACRLTRNSMRFGLLDRQIDRACTPEHLVHMRRAPSKHVDDKGPFVIRPPSGELPGVVDRRETLSGCELHQQRPIRGEARPGRRHQRVGGPARGRYRQTIPGAGRAPPPSRNAFGVGSSTCSRGE